MSGTSNEGTSDHEAVAIELNQKRKEYTGAVRKFVRSPNPFLDSIRPWVNDQGPAEIGRSRYAYADVHAEAVRLLLQERENEPSGDVIAAAFVDHEARVRKYGYGHTNRWKRVTPGGFVSRVIAGGAGITWALDNAGTTLASSLVRATVAAGSGYLISRPIAERKKLGEDNGYPPAPELPHDVSIMSQLSVVATMLLDEETHLMKREMAIQSSKQVARFAGVAVGLYVAVPQHF